MEADKSVGDTVTESNTIYQPSSCVEHRLETVLQIGRKTSQHCITVIQPVWITMSVMLTVEYMQLIETAQGTTLPLYTDLRQHHSYISLTFYNCFVHVFLVSVAGVLYTM